MQEKQKPEFKMKFRQNRFPKKDRYSSCFRHPDGAINATREKYIVGRL